MTGNNEKTSKLEILHAMQFSLSHRRGTKNMKNMSYSIKRLREEGHFCLSSLDDVESLDVFWAEANKVERLYIEDTNVYVAPLKTKRSEGEFVGLTCYRDNNYRTRLVIVGKADDIASLRSVTFRVLCLPEAGRPQSLAFSLSSYRPGRPVGTRDNVMLTAEQLRHIICAYPSRWFRFSDLSFTAEQSVEIVSHRKFKIEFFDCRFDDKGRAIVAWLENRNETDIMECCDLFRCDCYPAILRFLSRSMYPVFKRLYLDSIDIPSQLTPYVAAANVKSLDVDIRFFVCDKGWRAPLLQALRDGTFRPEILDISFICAPCHGKMNNEEIAIVGEFLQKLLVALSSRECSLKELHLWDFKLRGIGQEFKDDLIVMLQKNKSLRTLGVYSTMGLFSFPQMSILKVAAMHPHLRQLCFYPPTSDPPVPRPFQVWAKKNHFHDIRFETARDPEMRVQRDKWQNAVFSLFTGKYAALKQVQDPHARSYLLLTALATYRQMPDRIYYLLSDNQDVFAK
jgi:hypothetical protein